MSFPQLLWVVQGPVEDIALGLGELAPVVQISPHAVAILCHTGPLLYYCHCSEGTRRMVAQRGCCGGFVGASLGHQLVTPEAEEVESAGCDCVWAGEIFPARSRRQGGCEATWGFAGEGEAGCTGQLFLSGSPYCFLNVRANRWCV